MKILTILLVLAVAAHAEQLDGILDTLPADLLSGFMGKDSKILVPKDEDKAFEKGENEVKKSKPIPIVPPVRTPLAGSGKLLKAAAVAFPAKKVKKAVATKVAVPVAAGLKKKPKVHTLKPIVHIIEKPVPVYHKVPVPKKVIVPKFYPVYKKIPVPKIIPVPVKVPVKKIIPKIVKIPKAIPIPKIVPMKKPIPIAIPYPVPKFYKVPIPKPVPYAKYIPIPIPKKVPKFIPVPVKKIIKVPKPYYVPIKVPRITTSYIKKPMTVNVPDIKKVHLKGKPVDFKKSEMEVPDDKDLKFFKSLPGEGKGDESFLDTISNLGDEDKELLKLLAGGLPLETNGKI